MLIDNKEVLLSDFTVDTDINKVSFKQSSGRTSYRSRSLSYRSKLSLEFEDADTATEFVSDITALEVIPMVLEENDISPYGDELEVAGGTIPAVYEYYYIGNGVDSYIDLGSDLSIFNYIAISGRIKLDTLTGGQQTLFVQSYDTGVQIFEYLSFKLATDGKIRIYSNNTSFQRGVTTTFALTVGVEYDIVVTFNINNTFTLSIDGLPVTLVDYFVSTPSPSVTTLTTRIGSNEDLTTFFNGEIWELYWSTNILAVDKASIIANATGEEHFTQVAPDALLADWKGGATQGQIEISPEVPGAEILNFYLERAPTFKVDGYNNVTVELRTLLSKDNITYPTTYNSTILDTLPYDWKYRENIYTQFNNNTTLAGINYNTQNSTTGRSLRLQFRLLKTEYLELRKFIFNKRYTPFAYNSLVGGFSVDTIMVIGNYSMSFTGKLYNITLILEEQ
tara:strand:+ start:1477 stop:2823 length:1347 start_codon:yes stop_codon:yes gene_type:complete